MPIRVQMPLLLGVVLCAGGIGTAQATELTARDLRMEMRTRWDYQPMQGPKVRSTIEPETFRPTHGATAQEVAAPPPPLVENDWRDNPPRAEDLMPPKSMSDVPATKTAVEVGLQASSYHYHEKDLGVKLQGPQFGGHFVATGAIGAQWFLRGEGRFTAGDVDYKGSGTLDTNPNYFAEARLTFGRDFLTNRYGISPYTGIGYRFLHSDIRGVTSTGALGYQRDSHYAFVPVGVQPRMQFSNGDRLTLTAEYDYLLDGEQESYLSDVSVSYPDLANKQPAGYGIRSDVMYQTGNWAFGPFMNYWNINQSETTCGVGGGSTPLYVCGYEPHNHTLEYGFQFRYKFLED